MPAIFDHRAQRLPAVSLAAVVGVLRLQGTQTHKGTSVFSSSKSIPNSDNPFAHQFVLFVHFKHPCRYICKRRPNVKLAQLAAAQPGFVRPTNRAMRRRPALLHAAIMASCATDIAAFTQPAAPTPDAAALDEETPPTSGRAYSSPSDTCRRPALRRLETHVWHARRMCLAPLFRHLLPAQAAGKGKGSRSVMHVAATGFHVHDASYVGCLQVEGTVTGLKRTLRGVAAPQQVYALFGSPQFRAGLAEASLMLHRVGGWPAGAVAPVSMLLEPPAVSPLPGSATQDGEQAAFNPKKRRLWLWVHGAAYAEALAELRAAAAAAASDGTATASDSAAAFSVVAVTPRSGHLRRLQLVGARAFEVLAAAFPPAGSAPQQCAAARLLDLLRRCPALRHRLPDCVVLGLQVQHPLTAQLLSRGSGGGSGPGSGVSCPPGGATSAPQSALQSEFDALVQTFRANRPFGDDYISGARSLWSGPGCEGEGSGAAQCSPATRAVIDALRNAARLQWLHLPAALDASVPLSRLSCAACITLQRTPAGLPMASVVLPAQWVTPFWQALTYTGACVEASCDAECQDSHSLLLH